MKKEPSKAISYLAPLGVLLALIGAFFLGSRYPYYPRPSDLPGHENEYEVIGIDADVDVWLSKDRLFVWNRESPRPLEELPARIQLYKSTHSLRMASVSGDDLTRYSEMVDALSALKKAGFRSVTVETALKPDPSLH